MQRFFWICCALVCILCFAPTVRAVEAEEISGKKLIVERAGMDSVHMLFDGRTMESLRIRQGGYLTLADQTGIGSLYLVFGTEPGSYLVTNEDSGKSILCGEAGFLHEFLNLEEAFGYAPQRVTISFQKKDVQLCELSAFTAGQVPDWVQRWEQPKDAQTDLVLFSTHGDDEQLFFAGLLPYYAGERGYTVQVVYLTDHRNMTMRRCHEMLDGLWAVGVRNYPVLGPFGDYYSETLGDAYRIYRDKGFSKDDVISYVVENLRRFRPKVAVGHDLRGEYGHGMHMMYADVLCYAVGIAEDPEAFPESAQKYGTWNVPKTYLHLYPQNRIRMNWDIPLDSFGGMTAFEVTKRLGFPCHVSQQGEYGWYFAGMNAATDIPEYSPCIYGLYRSTVGEDTDAQDFFENVTTHTQDAQAEAERQAEAQRQEEAPQVETESMHPETMPSECVPAAPEAVRTPNEMDTVILILAIIVCGLAAFAAILGFVVFIRWKKVRMKK